jgi:hypothetical protein
MTAKEELSQIRTEIESLEAELHNKRRQICDIEKNCAHVWSEPKSEVRRIDFGEGHYGGSYDEFERSRECSICGKREILTFGN